MRSHAPATLRLKPARNVRGVFRPILVALPLAAGIADSAFAHDGALDPNFGTNGRVLTQFCPTCAQELNALVVQRDLATSTPKLVGAGVAGSPTMKPTIALVRYDLRGQLDRKFGNNGTVFTNFSMGGNASVADQAFALAVDSSERLVAAGSSFFNDGQSCRFALARYSPNGQVDTSFGDRGHVLTNVGPACDLANAVVTINHDGSEIAAGGTSGDPGTPPTASIATRFTVIRYTGDGHLDQRFHGNGIVRTQHFVMELPGAEKQSSQFDLLQALLVDRNDKLVAAGQAQFANGGQMIALARYNLDGSLDQTFGSGGMVLTPVMPSRANPWGLPAGAAAIRIQDDGKLVIAGQARLANNDLVSVLARYESDGRLDTSFGRGMVVSNLSPQTPRCNGLEGWEALALAADGKLVAAGGAVSQTDCLSQFVLARYNPDGTLDPSFGVNGIVRTFMPVDPGQFAVPLGGAAHALVIQPDGAMVAGGFALGGQFFAKMWALTRYRNAPIVVVPTQATAPPQGH